MARSVDMARTVERIVNCHYSDHEQYIQSVYIYIYIYIYLFSYDFSKVKTNLVNDFIIAGPKGVSNNYLDGHPR